MVGKRKRSEIWWKCIREENHFINERRDAQSKCRLTPSSFNLDSPDRETPKVKLHKKNHPAKLTCFGIYITEIELQYFLDDIFFFFLSFHPRNPFFTVAFVSHWGRHAEFAGTPHVLTPQDSVILFVLFFLLLLFCFLEQGFLTQVPSTFAPPTMRSLTTTASSFFLTALLLATNTVATVASAFSNNNVTTTAPYSTRMIASVITRQQGLVSSGAATSTLESGLVALAIQSWLSYYTSDSDLSSSTSSSSSSSADAETVYNFTAYVDAMLASISATEQFTNVSKTISLPLDRLTVGQAIGNLAGAYAYESEEDGSLGGQVHTSATSGGGGQRELTENEVLALDTLNASLALQNRNQYGGFW